MRKRNLLVAIAAVSMLALAAWSGVAAATGGSSSHGATKLKLGGRAAARTARVHPDTVKLLYSQLDNLSGGFMTDQNFEVEYTTADNQSADDFVVPPAQTWNVTKVDIAGAGTAPVFNVSFYADGGGVPGSLITTITSHSVSTAGSTYTIKIPAVTLNPGTYWVSVYSNSAYQTNGQWYTLGRSVVSGSPTVWRNPGNNFGTGCTNWTVASSCFSFGGPDLAFALRGNLAA